MSLSHKIIVSPGTNTNLTIDLNVFEIQKKKETGYRNNNNKYTKSIFRGLLTAAVEDYFHVTYMRAHIIGGGLI